MTYFPPTVPLRVIQVVNVRWFNATAWYGLFLASLLRDAGHDVRVLCLGGTESFLKAQCMGLDPIALDLNSSSPLDLADSFASMRRLVREFHPHIVNCHRGESFVLWGLLKHFGGFRLVRTRGDQRPPKANWANAVLHAKFADAVIATSSSVAQSLRDALRVPEDRLHTIFGGVDTRLFFQDPEGRARMRESWNLGPDELAVGLVGRFDTVKGQKELVAAFCRLREMPDTILRRMRLVLAGFSTSGVSEEAVRGWVRDTNLERYVIFPGRCGDVRGLMNALDIGVVASLGSETIARVALEIMACGTLLVGTRVGVMADLLEDAALMPPGDEAAMATVLHRFATDSAFAGTIRTGQQKRMAKLSERDFLEQTLAVYQKILAYPGGRTR